MNPAGGTAADEQDIAVPRAATTAMPWLPLSIFSRWSFRPSISIAVKQTEDSLDRLSEKALLDSDIPYNISSDNGHEAGQHKAVLLGGALSSTWSSACLLTP